MLSTGKIFLQHLLLLLFPLLLHCLPRFVADSLLWRLRFLSLKLAKSQNVRLGDNFKALRASLPPESRQQKMRVRSLCTPATPPLHYTSLLTLRTKWCLIFVNAPQPCPRPCRFAARHKHGDFFGDTQITHTPRMAYRRRPQMTNCINSFAACFFLNTLWWQRILWRWWAWQCIRHIYLLDGNFSLVRQERSQQYI